MNYNPVDEVNAILTESKKIAMEVDSIRFSLYSALVRTRKEPGLSLRGVAKEICDAFTSEEVDSLLSELIKKNHARTSVPF